MSKIKVVGCALVITTTVDCESIGKLKGFCKSALELTNEKGNTIFAISAADTGACFSSNGIQFASDSPDGLAQITVLIPELESMDKEEKAEYIKYNFAIVLDKLATIEKQMAEALPAIDTALDKVMESVEVE